MDKQAFVLSHAVARSKAIEAIKCAPDGFCVEVKPATRSILQNARLWAMLTDISRQVEWHGLKLAPEDWKHIFSAGLKKQRAVPGLDGGFVVLGQSTSKMTKAEMSELQELMSAFGSERDVKWSEPADQGYEEMARGVA
ncbi:NinB protein [Paraburkholderia phenazinium]|uniref:NinB protein n=1 Tax=Paraburkholderia phenazinium TaxID=60549 RepID=A0A1G7ZNR1_9BURK|nr:recombination protein NinB [Paraburkholderia phenazinium]SDH10391.1 NinB protein [Paraburkholderia phenazinium]